MFQAGELAVRGRWTRSTSRIVDFPKEFKGFWETVQRSRPELWAAGDDSSGVAVFLRVFNGSRLFFYIGQVVPREPRGQELRWNC